ncbi:metal ABC transporter substrate-binding protein [Niallia sp. 03133]|uniref:metal ABC transporter substrate-binding protein n=1 Tax=Niallia sp. 03133 TaxID=3458060 RepID=UPI004043DCF0
MKLLKTILAVFSVLILIVGCSNNKENSDSQNTSQKDKLQIVTTFYPMYEFTKKIAGEKANVTLLIPSTIEPHDWEPTPKDVGNIQKADLFIYNSTEMETWVPEIIGTLNGANVTFVEASKGITLLQEAEEQHEGEDHEASEEQHSHEVDPHVWLSPVLAQQEVETITKAIIKEDPKNKDYYNQNSTSFLQKLKDLDSKYKTELQNKTSNEFITQHTAFSYLANQYGLIQVPIAGLSPEQEPSAAKLADLKEFAKEHAIKVIYFEELASTKVADTLANEVGAKTEVLNPLEGLSTKDQKEGKDYISVMEENLAQLKISLFK